MMANEKQIGRITSAAYSPDLQCIVAMGMVNTDYSKQTIIAQTPEGNLSGTIAPLPMM